MKHIFFVISFVLAVFSKSEAMDNLYTLEGIPTQLFHIVQQNGRLHTDFIQTPSIHLKAENYNGIPMYAPLVISANYSSNEMANAIATAFRKNVIVQSLQ